MIFQNETSEFIINKDTNLNLDWNDAKSKQKGKRKQNKCDILREKKL